MFNLFFDLYNLPKPKLELIYINLYNLHLYILIHLLYVLHSASIRLAGISAIEKQFYYYYYILCMYVCTLLFYSFNIVCSYDCVYEDPTKKKSSVYLNVRCI